MNNDVLNMFGISFNPSLGKLEVKKFIADSITIPNKVGEQDLEELGPELFKGQGLSAVSLPDTLKVIGDEAFASNRLRSVTIPSSVKTIGAEAFKGNFIREVVLQEGLTEIDMSAFKDNLLATIEIPDSVDYIGLSAFQDNSKDLTIVCSKGSEAERYARAAKHNIRYKGGEDTSPKIKQSNIFG